MDSDCRLYLLTPAVLPDDFASRLAEALDAGDVAAVRLRLADAALLRAAAEQLRPIVQARGVAFLLGGDAPLAAALSCDGVHLDSDDMPAGQARRLIGDLQLGVFCGLSRDRAMDAGDAGADYIAFGPFCLVTEGGAEPGAEPSAEPGVEPGADPGAAADPELISWWSELMELPVVAEGGITAENCAPLVRAGADFLAVGDAVWNNPQGPAAAIRALNAAIEAA